MEIRLKHALAAVAVAASLQSALAQQGPSDGKQKPPQAGVIIVKPQTVVQTKNLPARLEASREAVIQPQVSGIVQKRLFEEGVMVRAGQQLYQIDDAVYLANL